MVDDQVSGSEHGRIRRRDAPEEGYAALTAGAIAVLTLLLLGCGARTEYAASDVHVERTDWDSVRVDVAFARRTAIGGNAAVQPESVVLTILDEDYDTLYSGPPGSVVIDDAGLGDRERMTIETCGVIRLRQICAQETMRASAKRLQVDGEIDYPTPSDLTRGSFDFTFQVQRQAFDGDGWQAVGNPNVSGHLTAYVNDPDAREQGVVRIPITQERGTFDLSRYPNYKNFRFYLDSELLDADTAFVHFDVYAGLGTTTRLSWSTRKQVLEKTDSERVDDVRYFVEQATELIIDELGSFLGGRRAVAYVDEWTYQTLSQIYRIEMDVEWRGPIFDRGRFELRGTLEVRENGAGATFEVRNGNRRALRRWRVRTDGNVLRLGNLEVRQDEPAS